MRFQMNIQLTEEDYVEFNRFHMQESENGKRMIRKLQYLMILLTVLIMVVVISQQGWTTFSMLYCVVLSVFMTVLILRFKAILGKNAKKQVAALKKTGKLPYDPEAKLEFYEDKLVEVTASKKIEQNYEALERIYVVQERYIYLYNSISSAYILPVIQLRNQLDLEEFLAFLGEKCGCVEYC